MSYSKFQHEDQVHLRRDSDSAWIPQRAGNKDYEDFLVWNAAQEAPLDLTPDPYTPPTQAERDADFRARARDYIVNGSGRELELIRAVAKVCATRFGITNGRMLNDVLDELMD